MFLLVPNRLDIALSLEAVPILPLDVAGTSACPAPLLDIGRLEGGRDMSIALKFYLN